MRLAVWLRHETSQNSGDRALQGIPAGALSALCHRTGMHRKVCLAGMLSGA